MPRPWSRKRASPAPAAPAVERLATELRAVRAEICDVASAIPRAVWPSPSPLPGWTYRDLLSHVAVDHWLVQIVLAAAAVNPLRKFNAVDGSLVDATSSVLREEWHDRALPDVIRKVEVEGKETQRLVARFLEADSRQRTGSWAAVGHYLDSALRHDREHLAQLRSALSSK